ncbi:MAG: hypothetical protein V3V01_17210, partial [Acidimicrobiales bacterium]
QPPAELAISPNYQPPHRTKPGRNTNPLVEPDLPSSTRWKNQPTGGGQPPPPERDPNPSLF